MDSFSERDIYDCDSKDTLLAVEETWKDVISSKGSVSSSSMRSLIVTVLTGFAVLLFLVVWQQTQLNTMQLEVDNLLKDEIDAGDLLMDEELIIKENKTEKAVISRQRRRAYNHQSPRLTPYAYLKEIMNKPNEGVAYEWSRPPASNMSNKSLADSFMQLYPSNGENVQAIKVLCSGWYYVYAQVPYNLNSNALLGHKIVRVGYCGRGYPEPVLQTLVNLLNDHNNRAQQNWKYLGGIVHLAAGDHVEVQPATAVNISSWLYTGSLEKQRGGFFGVYQVQQETQRFCNSCL